MNESFFSYTLGNNIVALVDDVQHNNSWGNIFQMTEHVIHDDQFMLVKQYSLSSDNLCFLFTKVDGMPLITAKGKPMNITCEPEMLLKILISHNKEEYKNLELEHYNIKKKVLGEYLGIQIKLEKKSNLLH